MREKMLVIGGSGSLGKQIIEEAKADYEVIGTGFQNRTESSGLLSLDISDQNAVNSIFEKTNPDIVIVVAAKTNVEACELNPNEAFKINVKGLTNIVANSKDRKIIFYSTDGVFDGTRRFYTEEDLPNPINVYGKSKLEGEKLIREVPNHLICRGSRYYGFGKASSKYLNLLINRLENGEQVKVPINTSGNFTFIPDISAATLALLKANRTGTYHVAGADVYTLCEAAQKVAEVFGFNTFLIHPVEENYFNVKVKRPCSPLSIAKLNHENIKMSTLEEGLIKIKKTRF